MKKLFITVISCFMILAYCKVAYAQPGVLDATFGNNGIFTSHANFTNEKAEDVALSNDGKILVLTLASDWSSNYLIRFQPNGNIDSSFGDNGDREILINQYQTATALAIDSSDRILVLAENNDYYDQGMFVYRFLSDGMVDISFGNNGKVATGFDQSNDILLVQPDGKIIVTGASYYFNRVARFNDDGSWDFSYMLNYGCNPYAVSLDQNNRILITGSNPSNDDLFVARLLPDGDPDISFSGDGYAIVSNGGNEVGQDVSAMPDGRVVVTGYSELPDASSANCWRFLEDGSPDNSFGDSGLVTLDSSAYFNFGFFIFPNEDSTIVVGASVFNRRSNDPVLYKLLNDGSKDSTFGSNGIAGRIFTCTKYVELNGVRSSSGNIIVCGTEVNNGSNQSALSQFLPDGSIDTSFGANGLTTLAVNDSSYDYDELYDFTVLPDSNILCVANSAFFGTVLFKLSPTGEIDNSFGQNGIFVPDGEGYGDPEFVAADSNQIYVVTQCDHYFYDFEPSFYVYDYSPFAVLKLHADGSIDSSYGISGVTEPTFSGYSFGECSSVSIQTDGKLLCAGLIYYLNKNYLVRLNQNGSVDTSFGDSGILIMDNPYTWYFLISSLDNGKILCGIEHQVLRLLPDGSIDSTYGVNGWSVYLNYDYGTFRDVPITIQPDNKIIVALFNYDGQYHYTLARINENGTLDNSFGDNGYSYEPDYYHFTSLRIQLQPDDKIVCGGTVTSTFWWGATAALRLLSDGTPDLIFGNQGLARCDSSANGIAVTNMHLQPDDKILLSGQKFNSDFYMVRLLNDFGTADESLAPPSLLSVYPNPSSEQLFIENPFSQEETSVTISNLFGQIVFRELVQQKHHIAINVKNLSSGIYSVCLRTSKETSSAKFVKQ